MRLLDNMLDDRAYEFLEETLIGYYVLRTGGEVRPTFAYDEEAVDCWTWEYDGLEFWQLGIHEDPPAVPIEMVKYVKAKTNDWMM